MNGTLFNSLFQSQLWSIVTSGGSAFHNINITCSVTKTFSATNCLGYDTITDMMLLLLRNHGDAFRQRKCLIPLALHCDYSWHWTTPGPQRSWAESRRLLLARDYAWPVTPAGRTDLVGGPHAALGPQVARERDWTVTAPHWAYWQQLKDLSLNFSQFP